MMHCMNMFLNVSLSVFLYGIKVKLFKLQTGSSFTVKISIFSHLISMVMFLFLNVFKFRLEDKIICRFNLIKHKI